MNVVDDGELNEALACDPAGAFAGLVRANADLVYTVAYRCSGSRADAEDLAQEAFVRAYRALCGYPPDRIRELRLQAWLVTIVVNLWRNELRRRGRRVRESPLEAAGDPGSDLLDPADEVVGRSSGAALAARLLELPWHERAPVVLRHVAGLGYADIAEVLSCPVGTAKARVHRGLASLRASLGAGAGASSDPSPQFQEA
jgi:RNA polymerase sigma factor (sigma-70 family)